jgi:hypothetical protein
VWLCLLRQPPPRLGYAIQLCTQQPKRSSLVPRASRELQLLRPPSGPCWRVHVALGVRLGHSASRLNVRCVRKPPWRATYEYTPEMALISTFVRRPGSGHRCQNRVLLCSQFGPMPLHKFPRRSDAVFAISIGILWHRPFETDLPRTMTEFQHKHFIRARSYTPV